MRAPVPTRRLAHLLGLLVVLVAFIGPPRALEAHDFRPAVLSIKASEPGVYTTRWSPPRLVPGQTPVAPVYPETCEAAATEVRCEGGAPPSPIAFTGLAGTNVEVVVVFEALDGTVRTQIVSDDHRRFEIDSENPPAVETGGLARRYGVLGFEHILEGLDHLLFVTGLMFVVGIRRRLFWTITAFTAAHSVTLAASILGWVRLAPQPVEFIIALSIVLVAREALEDRPTLTRRYPWLVAFLFGLIHGFGFSGALAEIGLPREEITVPLLSFNLGVELGQLLVVAVLAALSVPGRRLSTRAPWIQTAAIYLMGITAAYWCIERFLAMVTAG